MRRFVLFTGVMLALAATGWAQDMSGSSGSSATDSMMAPADTMSGAPAMKGSTDSMMAAPDSMSGSDSMMAEGMSYDTLKKEGKLADTRMGMQLRYAKSTGMKVIYTDLMSAETLAAKGPTVLFFAADWCPSCQADLKDLNANGSRLGSINVVVVDYDKSADLKMKYGITVQDTFVQIGAMGEKLAIWNGGGVQGILGHVRKAM